MPDGDEYYTGYNAFIYIYIHIIITVFAAIISSKIYLYTSKHLVRPNSIDMVSTLSYRNDDSVSQLNDTHNFFDCLKICFNVPDIRTQWSIGKSYTQICFRYSFLELLLLLSVLWMFFNPFNAFVALVFVNNYYGCALSYTNRVNVQLKMDRVGNATHL